MSTTVDHSISRSHEAERMRKRRSAERDIDIPECVDPERRANAESDIYLWLKTYFPTRFYHPFTADQREMVDAILHGAARGRDQAIAAPRGGGKTTVAECVTIYCLLTGVLKFPLIVAATGPHAMRILSNIKAEIEFNDMLFEDYPEACAPVRALEGANQRCGMQTYNGERTRMQWKGDVIVLPTIAGSKASGSIVMTCGLDGAIRGVRLGGVRPDFVLIDDAETRDSAKSAKQTKDRELTIEQDIAGLGGPGAKIAKLFLCTIMYQECLAETYTNRKKKPAWLGVRHALLMQPPRATSLWEQYIQMRQSGKESGEDVDGREAHAFYLANRKKMDEGAVVSNAHRYIGDTLEDGTQQEVSALQHCYNIIADRGMASFLTEYQNDPQEEEAEDRERITPHVVSNRLNGLERYTCPDDTVVLTKMLDIGHRRIHHVTIAWTKGAAGYVCDYGVTNVSRAKGCRD